MTAARPSKAPLYAKLGVKAGLTVWVSGAPAGYRRELSKGGRLRVTARRARELDFMHFFARTRASLVREMPKLRASMKPDAALWISWRKRSSGAATDLDDGVVRAVGNAAGLVDVKICAVDGVWSALKLVIRLRDRRPPLGSATRRR